MSYPLDLFAGDVKKNLDELVEDMAATGQAVSEAMTPTPERAAEIAEIRRVAADRARPYTLPENDRDAVIVSAAQLVAEPEASFTPLRQKMAADYKQVRGLLLGRFETHMLKHLNGTLLDFASGHKRAASRGDLDGITASIGQLVAGLDTTSQEFLAGAVVEAILAGHLIDAGNAFANLDATRYVAMQRYTAGKAPAGWTERLPRPWISVFSEATWTVLDKAGEFVVGEVLPSVAGPVGSIIVGTARVIGDIQKERREDREAFKRGSVDDLLDVARQLRSATKEAQRALDVVDAIGDLVLKTPAGEPITRASSGTPSRTG